jgi:hypothetical protein
MKPVDCEFEVDVLAAVLQSRWPERVDAYLRAHAAQCAICSDVAAIAGVFDLARQETHTSAALPDASRVWWSAQLRARREAATAAIRPIAATQIIACAWAIGLLGACAGIGFAWFHATGSWIATSFNAFDANAFVLSVIALLVEHGGLVLYSAALAFVLPAAAYFALGRD